MNLRALPLTTRNTWPVLAHLIQYVLRCSVVCTVDAEAIFVGHAVRKNVLSSEKSLWQCCNFGNEYANESEFELRLRFSFPLCDACNRLWRRGFRFCGLPVQQVREGYLETSPAGSPVENGKDFDWFPWKLKRLLACLGDVVRPLQLKEYIRWFANTNNLAVCC